LKNIATFGLTQVLKMVEATGLKLNRKIQAMAVRICDRHEVTRRQKKNIKIIFEIPLYKSVSELVWFISMIKFEVNAYLTSR